jgi:hypothetical protein
MQPYSVNCAKSIFSSKVFWGSVFTFIIALAPYLQTIADRGISLQTVIPIILAIATTGLTIIGRVDANQPVYTPSFLPGAKKEDFEVTLTDPVSIGDLSDAN